MAYAINKSDGSVLVTVSEGTVDTTSVGLVLIGKNYTGYGEFINENNIKLLENFASTVAPSTPIAGQLWWDASGSVMKVYTGTTFKPISSSTASASTPLSSITGDLWWDTTNGQLKVYNGTDWVIIGPMFTTGTGTSGAIIEVIPDTLAVDHVVTMVYVNNTIVSSTSKDAEFTPQSAISGFATIKPGTQLSSTLSGAKFHGTATDADALGGVDAVNFLRTDQSDSTSGVFSVLNDTGLVLGADSDLTITIDGSSNPTLTNTNTNGSIVLVPNGTGTIGMSSKRVVDVATPTTGTDAANKSYVDTSVSSAGVSLSADNIWSGSQRYAITADNDGSFDMDAGQTFTWTPAGADTLEFTNPASGQFGIIRLDNSGGNAITLGANIEASIDTAADISIAGVYLISYFCYDGVNISVAYTDGMV